MLYNSKPINSAVLLKIAKYKTKGMSLHCEDFDGRFHAYILSKHEISLHYDVYVTRRSKAHFSPPMPIKMSKEIRRLNSIIRNLKEQNRIR